MADWHPIETAPKNGVPIWLGAKHSIRVGCWQKDYWADWYHSGGWNDSIGFEPTHWQPLPDPPKEQDDD